MAAPSSSVVAQDPVIASHERAQRARATQWARVVATVVFILATVLFAVTRTGDSGEGAITKTTVVEETTTTVGEPQTVSKTKTSETSSGEIDDSLLGRVLGASPSPILFQILLAVLAAFVAGAMVQRIWLGEYGFTIGGVSIPALPPVSAETAKEAVELITESPEISEILDPGHRGPQPFPQFSSIHDHRLSLLSIRIELEERLRQLAAAADIDEDVSLERIPQRLVAKGVINKNIARGLRQFVEIGDRIAAGAKVEPEAETRLRDRAYDVLYALGELKRRLSQAG